MQLTAAQKRRLIDDGYVLVPDVVPPAMVHAALKAINHGLDQGMPPDQMTTFRAQSYCPHLRQQPVITDLFNKTPALPLTESALGPGLIKPPDNGQIALRFPTTEEKPFEMTPHIDGMPTATNGIAPGTLRSFTALVGVLLSDATAPNAGNFAVWPGSHLLHARYLRERTPQSLLRGMPDVTYGPKHQITGKPGDIVLAHYLLGHTATANTSPHIRYTVFFRLSHVDHAAHSWESLTDPWMEWPGLHDLV